MRNLCIQIQSKRAPALDVETLRSLCDALAKNSPLVNRITYVEGDDNGPYLNLMFETENLEALWNLLKINLYGDSNSGHFIGQASIATCEGSKGWDNFLLLHHFDRTLKLDGFSGRKFHE